MKKCETTKLFYNEYPYKVVISNVLAPIFREKNLAQAKDVLDQIQSVYEENLPLVRNYGMRVEHISHKTFFDAKNLYIEFSKKLAFKLRVERCTIQVYSHEYQWLSHISKKFSATEFWAPRTDIPKLDKNIIVVSNPTEFEYKVSLGESVDPALANWILSNKDKAKAGPVCLREIANSGYVKGFYIYVRDEKVMQLLTLFIGNVQRIDKLVYIAKTDK